MAEFGQDSRAGFALSIQRTTKSFRIRSNHEMATALHCDRQRRADRYGMAETARTGQTKRVPLMGLVAPLSTTAYPSSLPSRKMAVVTIAPEFSSDATLSHWDSQAWNSMGVRKECYVSEYCDEVAGDWKDLRICEQLCHRICTPISLWL